MNSKILLAVVTVMVASAAQLLLKIGIRDATSGQAIGLHNLKNILVVAFNPKAFAALATYGLTAAMWIVVLSQLPLSVAYPILALSFVFVPILSVLFLHEQIEIVQMVGILLIMVGMALVVSVGR